MGEKLEYTESSSGSSTADTKAEGVENHSEISSSDWGQIVMTAKTQLDTSRQYKYARMKQIQENENLYLGIAEKEYKNPYDYCFPYMSGFVDQLMAEIDDVPTVTYGENDEADYRLAKKTSALFDQQVKSNLPHARWAIKDRFSKKLAIFSGVGILKFHTEGAPFRAVLNNVDHYDFHNEPGGGGLLENHLFCGEEGIFKTKEEIERGVKDGYYNEVHAGALINRTSSQQYKDNQESYNQRLNRYRGMGLDPESNNYVGQDIFKLVEWYLTYKGCRYYCLFEERSMTAIRICKLREMFSIIEPNEEALYPYITWHTNEDPKVFWSKAPCDDVRPIAITINKLLNQQLYNRDKQNMGQRLYDPEMIKDVKALSDWRVDGLVPVKAAANKNISQAVYRLDVGNLSGTTELVEFLNSFAGQKTGVTPGTQGNAASSQKVGIFYGEMQQISKRIGVYNSSYREAWAGIGMRFRQGLKDNIGDEKMQVKLMGAKGVEWSELTVQDMNPVRDYDIVVTGGADTLMQQQQQNERKAAALRLTSTTNPKWKDMQILKAAGYSDEELKDAWSLSDPGLKELLSEAAQAEQDIVSGKMPAINRGANAAFMQHIISFSENLSMEDKNKEDEIAIKLLEYAKAHAVIAAQNEARSALQLINDEKIRSGLAPQGGGAQGAMGGPEKPSVEQILTDPNAPGTGMSNRLTNKVTPAIGV